MTEWRDSLGQFFEGQVNSQQRQQEAEFARFLTDIVVPAYEDLRDELEKYGRDVTIRETESAASILVQNQGSEEITYRVQGRMFPNGVLPYAEVRFRERGGLRYIRVESMFRSGKPDYRVADITREEIIRNFLDNYTRRVKPR